MHINSYICLCCLIAYYSYICLGCLSAYIRLFGSVTPIHLYLYLYSCHIFNFNFVYLLCVANCLSIFTIVAFEVENCGVFHIFLVHIFFLHLYKYVFLSVPPIFNVFPFISDVSVSCIVMSPSTGVLVSLGVFRNRDILLVVAEQHRELRPRYYYIYISLLYICIWCVPYYIIL